MHSAHAIGDHLFVGIAIGPTEIVEVDCAWSSSGVESNGEFSDRDFNPPQGLVSNTGRAGWSPSRSGR